MYQNGIIKPKMRNTWHANQTALQVSILEGILYYHLKRQIPWTLVGQDMLSNPEWRHFLSLFVGRDWKGDKSPEEFISFFKLGTYLWRNVGGGAEMGERTFHMLARYLKLLSS